MANVWMGTPTTRDFSPQYVSSLVLTRVNGLMGWDAVQGQAIDAGRNHVVRRFLQHQQFEYLLMHDSDATWHPEAVDRLAERGLPVVTAVIFKREYPSVPTVGRFASIGPAGETYYSFGQTINRIVERVRREREAGKIPTDFANEQVFDRAPDDLEEIDGAGAHFMLIRRDVLEKIGAPWFECTAPGAGEDFDFCRKVQRAGFKLYVDYSVMTGHVVGPGMEIGAKQFLAAWHGAKVETVWAA
jgi:cellulose synthase/poly-beta-1,6-N-acetylglucosamine synthase-like glycosyltransferase